jgi:hypothetical protein
LRRCAAIIGPKWFTQRRTVRDRDAALREQILDVTKAERAMSRQISIGDFRRRIRPSPLVIRKKKQRSSSPPSCAGRQYRIYSDNAMVLHPLLLTQHWIEAFCVEVAVINLMPLDRKVFTTSRCSVAPKLAVTGLAYKIRIRSDVLPVVPAARELCASRNGKPLVLPLEQQP